MNARLKEMGPGIALALAGAAVLAGLVAVADHQYAAEEAAAAWRWKHITEPALVTCRARGGIGQLDGWGKVLCDR